MISQPPGGTGGARYGCRLLVWLLLLVPLSFAPAFGGDPTPVPVRVGTHQDYGRVVFDLPAKSDYHMTRDGQHVTIEFDKAGKIASPARGIRNVQSVVGGNGKAELVIAPGAVLREQRVGSRVVIDVLDPPTGSVLPASPRPGAPPASPPASPSVPVLPKPPQAALPTAAPEPPTPAPPPKPAELPPPLAPRAATAEVTPVTPAGGADARGEDAPQPSTLVVPFGVGGPLGAAAFRRGGTAIVVFDRPIALDLSALHDDPAFSTVTTQTLPASTVVLFRLDPATSLSVTSVPGAWRIAAVAGEPELKPIGATVADQRLALSASTASAVVTMSDPVTGGTLLVGTQRHSGQGMSVRRRSVEFSLLPTWLGVVVAPTSDMVALRTVQDGFLVVNDPHGLALSPPSETAEALGHAAAQTHHFDFLEQPRDVALQRLSRLVVDDAMVPPLARGQRRQDVARALLSLGMGAEAEALLQMAATDDPAQATSPDNAALTAIAALLAHRIDEAGGLDDRCLPVTDDMELWRAYRQAQLQPRSPSAATQLAATLPLLLSYPPEMRRRMLPIVAEALVEGGEIDAAAALLNARKADGSLDLARGMLEQAKGDTDAALATYDRLAQSRDQHVYARAAARAVDLRLAAGRIDAHEAAERLDRLQYAWRGDHLEEELRDRLVALREQSGDWRAALALLRENLALSPDNPVLRTRLSNAFAAFLRGSATDAMSPLAFVSLVDENADLLPTGPDGEALESRLADRLLALDLPQRAGPLLDKLMKAAPTGAGRAAFGARLAASRQSEGDSRGALDALSASDAPDLPKDLADRRTVLLATAQARGGDTEHALSELQTVDSPAGDEARAAILERANNWPAAQKALASYAAKTVPPDGALDETQRRTLLRLATAAARAADDATLATLRQTDTARMGSGPVADMFRLLTADKVRSVSDLKRSGQEAALARALPAELKALQQGGKQTR
jgi:tetratricopeptide (TPR) repeat protein